MCAAHRVCGLDGLYRFPACTQAMAMKNAGVINWYLPLITAVISFILAIIVLTHIMQVNAIITSMIGIYCIALSALTLGEMLAIKNKSCQKASHPFGWLFL